jgi:glutaredoxin 3
MKIRLFFKPSCPWCHEAFDWFASRNLSYEGVNVSADPAAFEEMRRLTGQGKVPSVEIDGKILADFDTGQLEQWWRQQGLPPV